jgi:hypothetical protein
MHDADLDRMRECWPAAAKDLLGSLLSVLTAAQGAFGGDLRLFLVLLVVATRSAEHPEYAELPYEALLQAARVRPPSLGTNVGSIAATLGLPKETVRRKVERLIETGWIERAGRELVLAPPPAAEARRVREALLRAALKTHRTIARLTAEAEPPAADPQDA